MLFSPSIPVLPSLCLFANCLKICQWHRKVWKKKQKTKHFRLQRSQKGPITRPLPGYYFLTSSLFIPYTPGSMFAKSCHLSHCISEPLYLVSGFWHSDSLLVDILWLLLLFWFLMADFCQPFPCFVGYDCVASFTPNLRPLQQVIWKGKKEIALNDSFFLRKRGYHGSVCSERVGSKSLSINTLIHTCPHSLMHEDHTLMNLLPIAPGDYRRVCECFGFFRFYIPHLWLDYLIRSSVST